MLEFTNFNNWYYGIGLKSIKIGTVNVGVFNIQGVSNLISKEEYEVFPIEIIAKDTTRLLRAIERESNPDCAEICRRFLADAEDFKNIPFFTFPFYNEANNSLEENWNQFRKKYKTIEELL